MALIRGCYYQILRPRRHFAQFADGFCRYADALVHLNPHRGRQATKSYVERGNASGFIPHFALPPVGYPTAHCRNLIKTARATLAFFAAIPRRESDKFSASSIITWDRTALRRDAIGQVDEHLVDVAPTPTFRRIVTFDNWM